MRHVRKLVPGKVNNDSPDEDYELGMLGLVLRVDADIWRFGLKGQATMVGDEIGKNTLDDDLVYEHLGSRMGTWRMSTTEIAQMLFKKWNFVYLQVPTHNGSMLPFTYEWWTTRLGPGRVIQVPDPTFLPEVRAGWYYVCETATPSRQGFEAFLREGVERETLSRYEMDKVWGWLQQASPHFGCQTRLPNWGQIPLPDPNNHYRYYRDLWPIGHPRERENPAPQEWEVVTPQSPEPDSTPIKAPGKKIPLGQALSPHSSPNSLSIFSKMDYPSMLGILSNPGKAKSLFELVVFSLPIISEPQTHALPECSTSIDMYRY